MPTAKHHWTSVCFFWVGVLMSAAAVTVVLARDTKLIWRFEQSDFPLSGVFAALAALAFLATELCDSLKRPASSQGPGRADAARN
jgi:hypothetical protein